jgi:hypothetical protein
VAGVIHYLTGRAVRQRELSELLGQRWARDGTTMHDACSLVRKFTDIEVQQRATASFAQVATAIDQKRPMLASLHVNETCGHMVTVVGVVRGAGSAVIVNDSNFRWPMLVPWAEFAASLKGIAFIGVPRDPPPQQSPVALPPARYIEPVSITG